MNAPPQYLQAQGQAKAIEKTFAAIKAGRPTPEMLAYQYLQTLPQMAKGEANKVWLVPSDFGSALQGFTKMLGAPGEDGVFRYSRRRWRRTCPSPRTIPPRSPSGSTRRPTRRSLRRSPRRWPRRAHRSREPSIRRRSTRRFASSSSRRLNMRSGSRRRHPLVHGTAQQDL